MLKVGAHEGALQHEGRDLVHYLDQRYVHNIIMTPYIVTNLTLTLTIDTRPDHFHESMP